MLTDLSSVKLIFDGGGYKQPQKLKQKSVQGPPIKNGQSWTELYCFKEKHLGLMGS